MTWADALVHLSERYLGGASAPSAERYQVVVHVRADRPGRDASLHLGPALPAGLRRYRSCDATLRLLLEDDAGPVALGRRRRTVPTAQRRVIEARDRGCRVPGCAASRWLHVHHLVHWEDGGRTDPDNLVCLCSAHHRAHHKGELTIEGDPTTVDAWSSPPPPAGCSPGRPARAHPPVHRPRRPGPSAWPRPTGATRAASASTAAGSSSPGRADAPCDGT